jgi:hypothetical protein
VRVSTAIDSSGCEQVVQLWRSFPVFETIGDHAQCQRLCPRQRFVARGPVGEYASKIDDLSEPATICLLFELYFMRLSGHASQPSTINRAHLLAMEQRAPTMRVTSRSKTASGPPLSPSLRRSATGVVVQSVSGKSCNAATCRGRRMLKWRRSNVASFGSRSRSVMANTAASTRPISASAYWSHNSRARR